jgi:hypothetical protein
MQQIYPDLWKTEPEHPVPDKLPDLMMHAYLLVREQGKTCSSAAPSIMPTTRASRARAGSRTTI